MKDKNIPLTSFKGGFIKNIPLTPFKGGIKNINR